MYFHRDQTPPQSTRLRAGTMPVVIFYEDIASAERALKSLRELMRSRHDPREIQPMLWQCSLLEHAHWMRLAAIDAAHAELCLVSLGHARGISTSVASWFREMTPRTDPRWITLSPFEAVTEQHIFARRAS